MIKTMYNFPFLLIFLALVNMSGAERSAPFSLSVGTQSVGVRYQFTDQCALVESANEIAALGSDTLKIAFTPSYADDYRLEKDACINSVMDLVRHKPSYQQVMDMPFRNIMLWVYPFSDSKSAFSEGVISETEAKAVYKEIYDFTAYLLKRYSGSGKSFFLGNWEGDWHLQNEAFVYDLDPEPEAIAGAIQWFNLREKAVADARRETPHSEVEVYYYIELNHVAKSLDHDRPSIVNRVLPHIRTDYVSWSSYDVTKPAALLGPPFAARAKTTSSSHGHPFSRAYRRQSTCPCSAAAVHYLALDIFVPFKICKLSCFGRSLQFAFCPLFTIVCFQVL